MAVESFADHLFADQWLWAPIQELPPNSLPPAPPECPPAPEIAEAPPDHTETPGTVDVVAEQPEPALQTQAESPVATPTTFAQAVTLHQLGRFEEALALYAEIPEADESYPDALANRIAVAAARKDNSTLRACGEELLKLRHKPLRALQALMQAAMAAGDYEAAAQHGIRLVRQAPDSHEAWFNLGFCYQQTNHSQDAVRAYGEAIKLRPDAIRPHANLGILLQAAGDRSAACREFEQVLALEPESCPTLWNLALIYEEEGHIAKAEKILLRLIREEYQVYNVAFRLGRLRLNRRNYIGAAEAFERCLLERTGDSAAETSLSVAKQHSRGSDGSRGISEEPNPADGSVKRSDSVEGLALEATLAVESNDWKTASDIEAKLSQMGEDTAILAYNIGLLQQQENLLSLAIHSYERASTQRPWLPEAHLNRGHALMQAGLADQAHAAWKQALEMKPEIAASYFKGATLSELPA
ncbi:MAG: tetratricopeptide repeat protein [Acidobacteriota bacterium]|nr:tetratricopeptide repeat protein [Acidobacteriota bacterium]